MRALVLSGGKGTRLRPITHTFAKQLIPVANKPILFYGLEAISKAGIREAGIIVGDTAEEIKKAVGDGSSFGLQVTYIPQEAPLGLAHAVKISRGFLRNEPFVMYLGDNLIKEGIHQIVQDFQKTKPNAQILVAKVPNPSQFGVVELKDGKAVRLEEKPEHPKSDLALVGVYLFDHHIFEVIETLRPSGRGELEITDAIQCLIDRKFCVLPKMIDGWWKDTGKLEDLLEANRIILDTFSENQSRPAGIDERSRIEGKVVMESPCTVQNSVIRGPVILGKNVSIRDSYVGPYTSVYHDVEIENSEIEHSIVLEHARIRNVKRIRDSLIGQKVEVVKSLSKPEAYRIMLGDSSRLEVP